MYQMSHYTRVNCEGTSALLEAIARCEHRPRQVVLASSRSVYGEGAYIHPDAPDRFVTVAPRTRAALDAGIWEPRDAEGRLLQAVPTPEHLAFAPGSVYAATKAAQELLLNSACAALGVRSTVLRFQNVYGEGQSLQNPYTGIISIFFNRARQGLHIPVYEDGLESRDFVHVSDVVWALKRCVGDSTPNGIVLNVGSGKPTSVSHLAATLLAVSGLEVPVQVTGQYRLGDIRHCYADLQLAARWLGFAPRVSLEDGLRRFCAWAATQPVHADKSEQAQAELRTKGLSN